MRVPLVYLPAGPVPNCLGKQGGTLRKLFTRPHCKVHFVTEYCILLQVGKGRYYTPGSGSAQALKEKWGKRRDRRQRSRRRRLRRNRKRDRCDY